MSDDAARPTPGALECETPMYRLEGSQAAARRVPLRALSCYSPDMPEMHGARVTRDVEPEALPDLLAHPPRATVAFVHDGAANALPAQVRLEGAKRFAVAADAPDLHDREVVLVVDDGPYWFQLRGVSVRGTARRAAAPGESGAAPLAWYAIDVRRVLAWDYGTVRTA